MKKITIQERLRKKGEDHFNQHLNDLVDNHLKKTAKEIQRHLDILLVKPECVTLNQLQMIFSSVTAAWNQAEDAKKSAFTNVIVHIIEKISKSDPNRLFVLEPLGCIFIQQNFPFDLASFTSHTSTRNERYRYVVGINQIAAAFCSNYKSSKSYDDLSNDTQQILIAYIESEYLVGRHENVLIFGEKIIDLFVALADRSKFLLMISCSFRKLLNDGDVTSQQIKIFNKLLDAHLLTSDLYFDELLTLFECGLAIGSGLDTYNKIIDNLNLHIENHNLGRLNRGVYIAYKDYFKDRKLAAMFLAGEFLNCIEHIEQTKLDNDRNIFIYLFSLFITNQGNLNNVKVLDLPLISGEFLNNLLKIYESSQARGLARHQEIFELLEHGFLAPFKYVAGTEQKENFYTQVVKQTKGLNNAGSDFLKFLLIAFKNTSSYDDATVEEELLDLNNSEIPDTLQADRKYCDEDLQDLDDTLTTCSDIPDLSSQTTDLQIGEVSPSAETIHANTYTEIFSKLKIELQPAAVSKMTVPINAELSPKICNDPVIFENPSNPLSVDYQVPEQYKIPKKPKMKKKKKSGSDVDANISLEPVPTVANKKIEPIWMVGGEYSGCGYKTSSTIRINVADRSIINLDELDENNEIRKDKFNQLGGLLKKGAQTGLIAGALHGKAVHNEKNVKGFKPLKGCVVRNGSFYTTHFKKPSSDRVLCGFFETEKDKNYLTIDWAPNHKELLAASTKMSKQKLNNKINIKRR